MGGWLWSLCPSAEAGQFGSLCVPSSEFSSGHVGSRLVGFWVSSLCPPSNVFWRASCPPSSVWVDWGSRSPSLCSLPWLLDGIWSENLCSASWRNGEELFEMFCSSSVFGDTVSGLPAWVCCEGVPSSPNSGNRVNENFYQKLIICFQMMAQNLRFISKNIYHNSFRSTVY